MKLTVATPKAAILRPRSVRKALLLVILFIFSGIPMGNQSVSVSDEPEVEWIRFDLPEDSIRNLVGQLNENLSMEERPLLAPVSYTHLTLPTIYSV